LQYFFQVKTQRPPVGGWLISLKKSQINHLNAYGSGLHINIETSELKT